MVYSPGNFEIVVKKLESLDMQYPTVSEAHMLELAEAKSLLESEK
jgi:hypothetical protein